MLEINGLTGPTGRSSSAWLARYLPTGAGHGGEVLACLPPTRLWPGLWHSHGSWSLPVGIGSGAGCTGQVPHRYPL